MPIVEMDTFIPLVNRAIFSKPEREMTGGEITDFINRETNWDLPDSQVYLYLQRMCKQGLLETVEGKPEGQNQPKLYYRLTHNRPSRDQVSSPAGNTAPKTA